jgi:hypothetical protein
MDKDVILTVVVCATQIALALLGQNIRTTVKSMRRQQSAHNLFLNQIRDRLEGLPELPDMPTMRDAQLSVGAPRHERT